MDVPDPIELASDASLQKVWDTTVPYPHFKEMEYLPCITHVEVARGRKGEYCYYHSSGLAVHDGLVHLTWMNHPERECEKHGILIRGTRSDDNGMTWAQPQTWLEPPVLGCTGFNWPVVFSAQGKLWGFFTAYTDGDQNAHLHQWDADKDAWQSVDVTLPLCAVTSPPVKMADGNWLIPGQIGWHEAAVAISDGDDLTAWQIVQIPRADSVELFFPETAIRQHGKRLMVMCRPMGQEATPEHATGLVAFSEDHGRTWSSLRASNYPVKNSKPFMGTLSNGQHYVLANHPQEGRPLLTIAVTRPGEDLFCQVWKIRHDQYPVRRVYPGHDPNKESLVGKPTSWCYPSAVEHDGNLIISYSQGKENIVCSIVPLRALATCDA